MEKKVRKLLSGMSTASLIFSGSIPFMAQTTTKETQKKNTKQTVAVKQVPKSTIKDVKGKNDCKGKGECRTDGKPMEKTK
jgi:hypothetical protein